mmetsp:Transcript_14617/g.29965  ORF Transcript_14617/g.29965 Transcript_14617/m.29965 type:complete len:368 (-) Transcript_14617:2304-3407(-)
MNRLLGNRGNADEGDEVANYNECVAEIKKENPYIGHLALQQEAMKRVAQRRAAKQDNTQRDAKEDFAPQRIAFRRKTRASQKKGSSPSQSLSRSFIGFLSSSTNTAKTSNRTVVESQENNVVMAGRRTSTYNEEDAVHATAYAMRDIELSDSDDDTSNNTSKNSRRSSLSRRLSSLRGTMIRRQSASRRRSSTNSSISTLQRHSSDLSKEDSTIEKSLESKSVESKTDDDEKPQHKPQESGEKGEEEEEIMDFVEEFLAKGGRVRRTSLFSVEENKTCGESVSKSITSLGDGSSSHVAADGSLICGWGRGSLNESELIGADGEDLICNWDSRQSFLSNSSAPSNSDVTPERKQLPREINVGNNPDDR